MLMLAVSLPIRVSFKPGRQDRCLTCCELVQEHIARATEKMVLDRLEELHSRLARISWQHRSVTDRLVVIQTAEAAFDSMMTA